MKKLIAIPIFSDQIYLNNQIQQIYASPTSIYPFLAMTILDLVTQFDEISQQYAGYRSSGT